MPLMDWGAIASILAERDAHPIVLLDKSGRIRLFNRTMEQALGWTRFQVEGQLWSRACVPAEHHDETQRWITDALRGAVHSYESVAVTHAGARMMFVFELALVGRGPSQGLLMTATEVTPVKSTAGSLECQDLDYEVALAEDQLGLVLRLQGSAGPIPLQHGAARCYALIHGREGPCEPCPLVGTEAAPWPRIAVKHRPGTSGSKIFEIKTAEKIDSARARVRLRVLPEQALDAIHAAKVNELANLAALSPREREVLSYLLLGRNVDDISQLIGIASRTVKYHQANVLQKLGAESRADLLRLLF